MSNNLFNIEKVDVKVDGKVVDCFFEKILKATGLNIRIAENEAQSSIIKAKGEVEATLILTEGEIQEKELRLRAEQRWIAEEVRNQKNMEAILDGALPLLEYNAKPENIDNDLLTNFFEKCRIVSDKEMQSLWSRVLAGEANTPGKYSKRTINFIAELSKEEADLFTNLCGYMLLLDGMPKLVVYNYEDIIYAKNNINLKTLSHLDSIGLIKMIEPNIVTLNCYPEKLPEKFKVSYYNHFWGFEQDKSKKCSSGFAFDTEISWGLVKLTRLGEELFPICGSNPVDGFKEYTLEQWKNAAPHYIIRDL